MDDILQEYIWFNARILTGNTAAYNKTWCDAGIETIQDMLDGNSLLSKERLEETITCDFLFNNGVRSAIPNKGSKKYTKQAAQTLGLEKPNNLYQ